MRASVKVSGLFIIFRVRLVERVKVRFLTAIILLSYMPGILMAHVLFHSWPSNLMSVIGLKFLVSIDPGFRPW